MNTALTSICALSLAVPSALACDTVDFDGHVELPRTGPRDVAIEDLDADGDLDMAVANFFGDDDVFADTNVSVLLNDGTGFFAPDTAFGVDPGNTGAQAIATGDITGDGIPDVVAGLEVGSSIVVFANDGTGTLAAPTYHGHNLPSGGVWPNDVVLGDLDADGDLDVVSTGLHLSVMFNEGGTLGPEVVYDSLTSYGLALGDVDSDGDLDVACARFFGSSVPGTLLVFLNDGAGNLAAPVVVPAGWSPSSVDLADVDADGDLDAVVANWFSGLHQAKYVITVLVNDGAGGFSFDADYEAGERCRTARFYDIDGEGTPDITVSNNVGDDVSVLTNNGDGTFAEQLRFPAGDGNWGHAAGDLDADGDLDIATADYLGDQMTVLLNLCDPAPACDADLDGDGMVDGADLGLLLGDWGGSGAADLDGSGTIDGADLGLLLGAWGACS